MQLDDLTEPAPAPSAADWNDEGVVILHDFFDDDLLEAYDVEWKRENGFFNTHGGVLSASSPHGWPYCTPYMDHSALRALCCNADLAAALESLLGEPAGVHLNLTGWTSTLRDWHQDTYLNPEHVRDVYAAVWVALYDINERAGPFQYVPGSHKWHRLTMQKISRFVDPLDPMWPKHTETFLSPLVEKEIAERGADVVTHLPRRGDVLIWHPRLYHRGSPPEVVNAFRPALIAHYSGINHRPDMPKAVPANGGWMFPILTQTPVR